MKDFEEKHRFLNVSRVVEAPQAKKNSEKVCFIEKKKLRAAGEIFLGFLEDFEGKNAYIRKPPPLIGTCRPKGADFLNFNTPDTWVPTDSLYSVTGCPAKFTI